MDNPNLFPIFQRVGDVECSEGGVSLLDFFAAAAMAGDLANSRSVIDNLQASARWWYNAAEAMLAERARRMAEEKDA